MIVQATGGSTTTSSSSATQRTAATNMTQAQAAGATAGGGVVVVGARKRGRRRQQTIPEPSNGLDRVFVWDLDGSLLRADTIKPTPGDATVLTSVQDKLGVLSRQLENVILAFCDENLYLHELELSDQMHIDDVSAGEHAAATAAANEKQIIVGADKQPTAPIAKLEESGRNHHQPQQKTQTTAPLGLQQAALEPQVIQSSAASVITVQDHTTGEPAAAIYQHHHSNYDQQQQQQLDVTSFQAHEASSQLVVESSIGAHPDSLAYETSSDGLASVSSSADQSASSSAYWQSPEIVHHQHHDADSHHWHHPQVQHPQVAAAGHQQHSSQLVVQHHLHHPMEDRRQLHESQPHSQQHHIQQHEPDRHHQHPSQHSTHDHLHQHQTQVRQYPHHPHPHHNNHHLHQHNNHHHHHQLGHHQHHHSQVNQHSTQITSESQFQMNDAINYYGGHYHHAHGQYQSHVPLVELDHHHHPHHHHHNGAHAPLDQTQVIQSVPGSVALQQEIPNAEPISALYQQPNYGHHQIDSSSFRPLEGQIIEGASQSAHQDQLTYETSSDNLTPMTSSVDQSGSAYWQLQDLHQQQQQEAVDGHHWHQQPVQIAASHQHMNQYARSHHHHHRPVDQHGHLSVESHFQMTAADQYYGHYQHSHSQYQTPFTQLEDHHHHHQPDPNQHNGIPNGNLNSDSCDISDNNLDSTEPLATSTTTTTTTTTTNIIQPCKQEPNPNRLAPAQSCKVPSPAQTINTNSTTNNNGSNLKPVLNNHHKQMTQRLSAKFHRIRTIYNRFKSVDLTKPITQQTATNNQSEDSRTGNIDNDKNNNNNDSSTNPDDIDNNNTKSNECPNLNHQQVSIANDLQAILVEIDHYTLDWRKRAIECLGLISESPNCTNIIITKMPLVIALGHLICLGFSRFFDIDQVYSASKTSKETCLRRVKKRFGATNRCSYIIVGDEDDADMAKRLDLPCWKTTKSDGHTQQIQLYTALKEGFLM